MNAFLLAWPLLLSHCSIKMGNPLTDGSEQTQKNQTDTLYQAILKLSRITGTFLACAKPTPAEETNPKVQVECQFQDEAGNATASLQTLDSLVTEILISDKEKIKIDKEQKSTTEWPIQFIFSGLPWNELNKATDEMSIQFNLTKGEDTENIELDFKTFEKSDGDQATIKTLKVTGPHRYWRWRITSISSDQDIRVTELQFKIDGTYQTNTQESGRNNEIRVGNRLVSLSASHQRDEEDLENLFDNNTNGGGFKLEEFERRDPYNGNAWIMTDFGADVPVQISGYRYQTNENRACPDKGHLEFSDDNSIWYQAEGSNLIDACDGNNWISADF